MATNGQTATEHRKVRELLRRLAQQGYRVQTEVSELPVRPDIVATKDGKTLVIEVRTQESLARDVDGLKALAAYSHQHEGVTFRLFVVRPRKKAATVKSRQATLVNGR